MLQGLTVASCVQRPQAVRQAHASGALERLDCRWKGSGRKRDPSVPEVPLNEAQELVYSLHEPSPSPHPPPPALHAALFIKAMLFIARVNRGSRAFG